MPAKTGIYFKCFDINQRIKLQLHQACHYIILSL